MRIPLALTGIALMSATSLSIAQVSTRAPGAPIRRASDRFGTEPTSASQSSDITGDGRLVVFASAAPELIPNDTNGVSDIFLKDVETGFIERISVRTNGAEANGGSFTPAISSNGRYVVFASRATNLVNGDNEGFQDIFLRDRQMGTTIRISENTNGVGGNGPSSEPDISENGERIVFASRATNIVLTNSGGFSITDTNNATDIFDYKTTDGSRTLLSHAWNGSATAANGSSGEPAVSGDGSSVVFTSAATNIVATDVNNRRDVFMRNFNGSIPKRVSERSGQGGLEDSFAPRINSNGDRIVFESRSPNLTLVDNNTVRDVFLADFLGINPGYSLSIASLNGNGTQFQSASRAADISSDGQWIAFRTSAALVVADTNNAMDIYQRNVMTGEIRWASSTTGGTGADGANLRPRLGSGGNYMSFESDATDLAPGDTNGLRDVYRYQSPLTLTAVASATVIGTPCPTQGSGSPATLDPGANTLPWVGETFRAVVRGPAPQAPVLMYLGPQVAPVNLGSAGLPGCIAYIDPQILLPIQSSNFGFSIFQFPIPVLPGLLGFQISAQAAVGAPSAPGLGLYTTNALEVVIGG